MILKRRREKGGGRSFRVEWEVAGSDGRVYLFGVRSFGAYTDDEKRFLTGAGRVAIYGKRLTVSTYRSGCVEVSGTILGVSLDPVGKGEKGNADD